MLTPVPTPRPAPVPRAQAALSIASRQAPAGGLRALTRGRDDSALRLMPGTTLGRYRILSHLASGGMAEVYLASTIASRGRESLVVLKRIRSALAADASLVSMFHAEARLGTRLEHRGLARVHEIGYDRRTDSHFFAMDYIHGVELRQVLRCLGRRQQGLPLDIALTVVIRAAEALDHVHNLSDDSGAPLGVVHRDISLSNILLGFDGRTRIIDFGVAQARTAVSLPERTLVGKYAYMSPEQCRAETVDRRSDVFSLGIVLYELTTMRRAYPHGLRGDDLLAHIARGPSPDPERVHPGYPPPLAGIVCRALSRSPAERFPGAGALARTLSLYARDRGHRISDRAVAAYVAALFPDELSPTPPWQRGTEGAIEPVPASSSAAADVTAPTVMELPAPPEPAMPMLSRSPALAMGLGIGVFLIGLLLAVLVLAGVG